MLDALERLYGKLDPPPTTDPLELVLWENVAYLASDERRAEAFRLLKKRVGTRPEAILGARGADLERSPEPDMAGTRGQAEATAAIALEQFGGELGAAARRPLPEARKALMKFPGIGAPGAEKILLLSRSHPVLGLDSNGVRVLVRLGFGREAKSYDATYRSAQGAAAPRLKADSRALVRAHVLLRHHGQPLCRRTRPRCEACPVAEVCAYCRGTVKSSAQR